MSATIGDGQKELFFSSFIKIRERQRAIKEHSNNKVIINYGKTKFTITCYYKRNTVETYKSLQKKFQKTVTI